MITNKGHPVDQSLVAEQGCKNNYRWSPLPPLLDDKNEKKKKRGYTVPAHFPQFREFSAKATDNYILQIEGLVYRIHPRLAKKNMKCDYNPTYNQYKFRISIEGLVCQDPPRPCQKSPFKSKHSPSLNFQHFFKCPKCN